MKKFSKVLALLLALVMVFALAACSGTKTTTTTTEPTTTDTSGDKLVTENTTADVEKTEGDVGFTETYTWTVGSSVSSTTLNKAIADYLADYLNKKSNGQITLNNYFDATLGNDAEIANEVYNRGSIDFYSAITTTFANYVPLAYCFDQYYLFTDVSKYYDMFAQEGFMDWLNEKAAEGGWRIMALNPAFFRELTANKPITTVDDIKGLNIRTMTSSVQLAFWKAVGANPTAVEYNELFTALQQGVVEAEENPYMNYVGANLQQVQKYVMETNHCLHNICLGMNSDAYAELPEAVQTLLTDGCTAASEYADSIREQAEAQYKKIATDAGNTIVTWDEITDGLKDAFYAAAKEQTKAIVEKVGQDTYDEFYAWAKPIGPSI